MSDPEKTLSEYIAEWEAEYGLEWPEMGQE
jgi:hypothetical protein